MAADHQVDTGAQALAARMLERTEEVAQGVATRIMELVPGYAGRVPFDELRQSVADHYRVIFDGLLDPRLDGDGPADLAGRSRAAEGVPMSAVFEAYQISMSSIWEQLAEAAERDEVAPRVALRAASALWRRLSGFTDVMSDSYRTELAVRIRGEELFGRDSLSVAAASAPETMVPLSRAILAGLEAMPADDRAILLDTFGAWLDHGGSADEAARRLYVHPNTVRYRLRRLEERTGRTLSDPRHVAELGLAFEVDRGRIASPAEDEGGAR